MSCSNNCAGCSCGGAEPAKDVPSNYSEDQWWYESLEQAVQHANVTMQEQQNAKRGLKIVQNLLTAAHDTESELESLKSNRDTTLDEMLKAEREIENLRKQVAELRSVMGAGPGAFYLQRPVDLAHLRPQLQQEVLSWLSDGTFVQRVVGALLEQERIIQSLENKINDQSKS